LSSIYTLASKPPRRIRRAQDPNIGGSYETSRGDADLVFGLVGTQQHGHRGADKIAPISGTDKDALRKAGEAGKPLMLKFADGAGLPRSAPTNYTNFLATMLTL
jgi:hypothetical protein